MTEIPAPSQAPVPDRPTVGVVIPTVGRDSLLRSVNTALEQTYPTTVVVVVVDGPLSLLGDRLDGLDERVVAVATERRGGPGAARNLGASKCGTDLVAFLDDDDFWEPGKTQAQVAAYRSARAGGAEHVVVTARLTDVAPDGRPLGPSRHRSLGPDEPVADYLFVKKQIRPGEAALAASMVLCDRALLDLVPFDTEGGGHEDWDWFVRTGARPDTRVVALEEMLVYYTVHPAGQSASSGIGWQESRDWAEQRAALLGPRHLADFALTVTAPLALRQRDWRGLAGIVAGVARSRSAGFPAWAGFGALCGHWLVTSALSRARVLVKTR